MDERLTDELLARLLEADDPGAFADENDISKLDIAALLAELLEKKGLKRAKVVKAAGLNPTYGYEIFTGQKHAQRDYYLRVALVMGCDLQETNRLLHAAQHEPLYCKNRRDAIIIYCVANGRSLMQTDEELYHFGEETLGDAPV